MRLPRLRLRTLLIAIAVLAPLFVGFAVLLKVVWRLEDFYGPRGRLVSEQLLASEVSAAQSDLEQSAFVSAEARYRKALTLDEEFRARWGKIGSTASREILLGLAQSVAGQHRYAEAETISRRIPDESMTVDFLERHAALERQIGNTAKANRLFARAKALRDAGDLYEH